ncbi:MAG: D-alanine--D-alanine ligase [Roseburia sp.]|nr:D-alanine--D-alanine ligase [Roseburia sp.]
MDIVVLAGGLSAERDVSLRSGGMITNALRENGHRVLLLDVFMGVYETEREVSDVFDHTEELSVKTEGIKEAAPDIAAVKASRKDKSDCYFGPNVISICRMADIVFLALHGENGENGKLQAAFDLFGIRYTGSNYLSSAIAMDKNITKMFFDMGGVPTPKGIKMTKEDRQDNIDLTGLRLPCVVKPCCGGSSIGVSIVRDKEEYKAALEEAFRWEDEVIIEDYIKGREFSVAVIEGKALPVIEMAPVEGFYDYKNKYQAGSTVETCPADIPKAVAVEMQHYAEEAARILGIDTYSRMDFLLNEAGEIFCLEANTLPGMTETSLIPQEAAVVGMNYRQLCEKLIQISLKK